MSVLPTPIKYYTSGIFEVGWQVQYDYTSLTRFQLIWSLKSNTNALLEQKITRYSLSLNSVVLVVSDNEKDIDAAREIILKEFNKTIISDEFSVLKNRFESLKEEHKYIIKKVGNILKDVESGTPLEGKCEIAICRGNKTIWHIKYLRLNET
jgi:hypothetical protein